MVLQFFLAFKLTKMRLAWVPAELTLTVSRSAAAEATRGPRRCKRRGQRTGRMDREGLKGLVRVSGASKEGTRGPLASGERRGLRKTSLAAVAWRGKEETKAS